MMIGSRVYIQGYDDIGTVTARILGPERYRVDFPDGSHVRCLPHEMCDASNVVKFYPKPIVVDFPCDGEST